MWIFILSLEIESGVFNLTNHPSVYKKDIPAMSALTSLFLFYVMGKVRKTLSGKFVIVHFLHSHHAYSSKRAIRVLGCVI